MPVTPAASTARRRSLRGALVLALDPGSATRSGELASLFAGVLVQAAGGRETAPAVVGDMIDILQRVDSDADTTRPHLAARARTAPGASVAPEAASG